MRLARYAVIVIPNHCLMPEHNGKEIMSNTNDFWNWFQTHFPVMMRNMNVPINKDQLLVSGESAGAFLAVYSWLTQPEAIAIKALYLQYPMLFYYDREPGVFFGRHVPLDMANKHLDKCLAEIQALKETDRLQSISAAHPPKHMTMAYCLSATKRWKEVFDHDDIEGMLGKKSDEPATFPEIFVYHGDADVQVPIQNTRTFINIVEKKWPEMIGKIHFTTVEGQAHAGDYEVDEREPGKEWLRDMLKGIKEAWFG
jgi:acetyl esterase/lipase